jgi:hypothetical protein
LLNQQELRRLIHELGTLGDQLEQVIVSGGDTF